jgi:ribosomal 30S subunit maturation factor RimM
VANCDRLPNESECELVYGFIVLLQEIFQNQKEVIDKEKHEHAKNLSIIQFERMNERMTLEKVCGELRDQLTTQINILFVT